MDKLITLARLEDKLAVDAAQSASRNAGVVSAVSRHDGRDGPHLLSSVVHVHSNVERLAELDLVHFDQIETDILGDLRRVVVDGLATIYAAHGVHRRQSIGRRAFIFVRECPNSVSELVAINQLSVFVKLCCLSRTSTGKIPPRRDKNEKIRRRVGVKTIMINNRIGQSKVFSSQYEGPNPDF